MNANTEFELIAIIMVRTYKRKTDRSNINEEQIKLAINDIINKVESERSAALKYGFSKSTLHYRLVKLKQKSADDSGAEDSDDEQKFQSKYASSQIFSKKQETELVAYFQECSNLQYGLTYDVARKFVFDYAERNKIKHPISWDISKRAGIDWLKSFMHRNPILSLRKPENTSLARCRGFNRDSVMEFYTNLEVVYRKYDLQPKDVFNIDETGVTTVMPSPKVISTKGKRTVSQAVSAERGSLVTFVGIINAAGQALPPVYVFPRLRYKDHFLQGGLEGCLGLVSKSGWMTADIFPSVLQHIKRHTNCSKENRVLLILDNHVSHVSFEAITYCQKNGIILLTLPPHTSHKLQPLDVVIFGPFKKACATTFNDWHVNHPGSAITIYNIADLTRTPFLRAFTPEKILKSFSVTGIFPFNSQAINEDEFSHEQESSNDNITEDTSAHAVQSNKISDSTATECNRENWSAEVNENISSRDPSAIDMQTTQLDCVLSPKDIRPLPPKSIASKRKRKPLKSKILTVSPNSGANFSTDGRITPELFNNESFTPVPAIHVAKKVICNKPRVLDPETSSESSFNISYAETEKSMGELSLDSAVNDNFEDIHKLQICDTDQLIAGQFVLVKFEAKKPVYYVGQIIKAHGQFAFDVSYLRKNHILRFFRAVTRGCVLRSAV